MGLRINGTKPNTVVYNLHEERSQPDRKKNTCLLIEPGWGTSSVWTTVHHRNNIFNISNVFYANM